MQSYPFITVNDAILRINVWAKQKKEFFFAFDYSLNKAIALLTSDIQAENILYKIGKYTNDTAKKKLTTNKLSMATTTHIACRLSLKM